MRIKPRSVTFWQRCAAAVRFDDVRRALDEPVLLCGCGNGDPCDADAAAAA